MTGRVGHRLRLNPDGAGLHGPGSIRGDGRRNGNRITVLRPGRRDQAAARMTCIRWAILEVEIKRPAAAIGEFSLMEIKGTSRNNGDGNLLNDSRRLQLFEDS
jgi:hypothetical protein